MPATDVSLRSDLPPEASPESPVSLEVGMRVRERATGQEGVVESIQWDNSCSDPGCCGGPFPDTANIRYACGHVQDVSSERRGGWTGFEIVSAPPVVTSSREGHEDDEDDDQDPAATSELVTEFRSERVLRTAVEVTAMLAAYPNAAFTCVGDATGRGVRVLHPILGPVGRIGWAVILRDSAVQAALTAVGPLPELAHALDSTLAEPDLVVPTPLESLLGAPIVEVATGQPGVVAEIEPADPEGRWSAVVTCQFACGHTDAQCLGDDGTLYGITAYAPGATA